MKRIRTLQLLFIFSLVGLNVMGEEKVQIVFKEIDSWNKTGKSLFPTIPEAYIIESTITINFNNTEFGELSIIIRNKQDAIIYSDNIPYTPSYNIDLSNYPHEDYFIEIWNEEVGFRGKFNL